MQIFTRISRREFCCPPVVNRCSIKVRNPDTEKKKIRLIKIWQTNGKDVNYLLWFINCVSVKNLTLASHMISLIL